MERKAVQVLQDLLGALQANESPIRTKLLGRALTEPELIDALEQAVKALEEPRNVD